MKDGKSTPLERKYKIKKFYKDYPILDNEKYVFNLKTKIIFNKKMNQKNGKKII